MHELLANARPLARALPGRDSRFARFAPSPAAVARLQDLHEPFPAAPSAPGDVLALLDELGSPATMGIAGPRFFGFVIGGTLPAALAANWLASAWDQNAAFASPSPVTAELEAVALEWMRELFGLPDGCAGAFVTGATMANFSALAAARHAVLTARIGTSRPTASSARPRSRRDRGGGASHADQGARSRGLRAQPARAHPRSTARAACAPRR